MKTSALNVLLDQVYQLDPGAFSILERFQGQIIQLQLSDVKQDFLLQITQTGLHAVEEPRDVIPDLIVNTTSISIIQFALFKVPVRQIQLHFEGNTDLALSLQRAAQCYQGRPTDWLAQHLGDAPIVFGKRLLSGIAQLIKSPLKTTCEQTADYLIYETQTLAPKPAVDSFNQAVNDLSLAVARLEAQASLLASQIDASHGV
jgi:ubiquinone biosynthesis protein UbiJ